MANFSIIRMASNRILLLSLAPSDAPKLTMGTAKARSARRIPTFVQTDFGNTASSIRRLILRAETPVATAASLIRIAFPGAMSVASGVDIIISK